MLCAKSRAGPDESFRSESTLRRLPTAKRDLHGRRLSRRHNRSAESRSQSSLPAFCRRYSTRRKRSSPLLSCRRPQKAPAAQTQLSSQLTTTRTTTNASKAQVVFATTCGCRLRHQLCQCQVLPVRLVEPYSVFALTECQRLSTVTNWNPDYMTILITSSSCIPRQTPRSHQDSSAIPCQATTPLSPRLARAGNIDGEGGGAPMGARAGVGTLVPTRKKVIRSVKQRIALRPCH